MKPNTTTEEGKKRASAADSSYYFFKSTPAELAKHYAPESLVGTQVVLVSNLKPRKIFGVESQGMLLTTEDAEGGVHLLRPGAPAPAGTRIQ